MKNIRLYEYLLNQALVEEELRYRAAVKSNNFLQLNDIKERIITMRANLLAANTKTHIVAS